MPTVASQPPEANGARRAIVVLGCRVGSEGPSAALTSRLRRCLDLAHQTSDPILLCGGKTWNGLTEAEAMRDWLALRGIAEGRLLLEASSQTTWENVHYSAPLLRQLRVATITLVTSDFHMLRARRLFEKAGLVVHPASAESRSRGWSRLRNRLREWGAGQLERVEEWRK